jgi:hypothetical protein
VDVDSRTRAARCARRARGHTEVVKLLLGAGVNVHAVDEVALRWASENGHTDAVKLLEAAKVRVAGCKGWRR